MTLMRRSLFGAILPNRNPAPPTVPDAPTIGTASVGNAESIVSFTPPINDGGSTITGYTVTSTPSSITAIGASSPLTVTGLSNGTAYTFTAHATNSVGNSAESSASNSVTPINAIRADTFTRANNTSSLGTPSDAGTDWVAQLGTWGIYNNSTVARANTYSTTTNASAVLEASSANVIITAEVYHGGYTNKAGLVIRAADMDNLIFCTIGTAGLALFRRVAGVNTAFGTNYTTGITDGDVISISVDSANNIIVKQNGTTRITTSDASGSANTKHGLWGSGATSIRFDNLTINGNP